MADAAAFGRKELRCFSASKQTDEVVAVNTVDSCSCFSSERHKRRKRNLIAALSCFNPELWEPFSRSFGLPGARRYEWMQLPVLDRTVINVLAGFLFSFFHEHRFQSDQFLPGKAFPENRSIEI